MQNNVTSKYDRIIHLGKSVTWPFAWIEWFNAAILCSIFVIPSAIFSSIIVGFYDVMFVHGVMLIYLLFPAILAWRNIDVAPDIYNPPTLFSIIYILPAIHVLYFVTSFVGEYFDGFYDINKSILLTAHINF